VAIAAAVAEVMKGLNFYIGNIVILSAYLNLRRSKKFGKIIPFLYLYLCLKGISTVDFSDVLKILTKMFTREDDQRESEISLPYRNPLMILKKPALSNEPFWVIGVIGAIGAIGDGLLGLRNVLAKGEWHPQPKNVLRTIFWSTDWCAEASRNSPQYASTGEILVFLANFFKPLIKIKESPQPRHQACCVHNAVKTNLWESMTESFRLLTLALTPEIIIIHEIYLPPTKGEALKVLYKFTEIFEAKYPESTVLLLTTPFIFIYPVTAYMSQVRNFILILNLILTMTSNFSMLKGRANPMNMIDSAKPLLIMIKSIITIGLEELPHPAPTSSLWRQNRCSGNGCTMRGLGISSSAFLRKTSHVSF
jgi:hypothetical protein